MSTLRKGPVGGKLGKVNFQERGLRNYVYNSMFSDLPVPSYEGNDGAEYNIGTQFKVLTDGHITAFKVWKVSIEPGGTFDCYLWDVSTKQIIYQTTITFPDDSSRGWITKTLDTPFPIVANKEYVFTNRAFYYPAAFGISRGTKDKITAIRGAYENSPLYPARSFNPETTYYRDVIFRHEAKSKQSPLLDKYPTPTVILCLRHRRGDYTGPAIRVRRSRDNSELDVWFDSDGDLDVNALLVFVGNGDGFVVVLYDQSGKGHHFVQLIFSRQPRIVIGGTLVTRNNKPSMRFLNSSLVCTMNTGDIVSQQKESSIFSVFESAPKDGAFFATKYSSSSVIGLYLPWIDGNTYYEMKDSISVSLRWDSLSLGSFVRNTTNVFINNNNVNRRTVINNPNFPPLTEEIALGSYPDGANPIDGYISEFIAYNSYLPNHESLVTELNDYYQVY